MIRRSVWILAILPVQPTLAIPMAQSPEEAKAAVERLYSSRWLGADASYLQFQPAQSHFVPFFLAKGTFTGTYTASVEYQETVHGPDGKSRTETRWRHVAPQSLRKAFFEHNTQVYAGYRRDPKHVRALMGEHLMTVAKPLNEVDVASADDMNAIEMSLTTLQSELQELVTNNATEVAKEQVRSRDSSAHSIRIHWDHKQLNIHAVTPIFVPAYIIPLQYGDVTYKAVVCGVRGLVSGPRLYNPETIARLSAAGALAISVLALRLGAMSAFGATFPLVTAAAVLGSYYGSFSLATKIPDWRLKSRKRAQDAQKARNAAAEQQQQGPSSSSSYQQQQDGGPQDGSSTSSATATERKRAQHLDDDNDAPNPHPNPLDEKGYYKRLGVARSASINEIKAAYRKRAMRVHPDMVGPGVKTQEGFTMAELNRAYQVLRNRTKRKQYDDGEDL